MSTTNTSRTAISADTMTVTVRDTEAEARNWGSGRGGIVTRTVTISAHCPRCGERRGEPFGHNFCDDGEWAWVQRWNNPCGHVDTYHDVLVEAATLVVPDNQPIDHPAEPRLAHPIDSAPFVGLTTAADGAAGDFLAGLTASVAIKQDRGLATRAETDPDDSTDDGTGEPEMPVSLATFQQHVADGAWTCKTSDGEQAEL